MDNIIFDKKIINELLQHYPPSLHPLILKQIKTMEEIFNDNVENYQNKDGFSEAFDLFLRKIVDGEFVLLEEKGDLL